jgi:hypothetical protein
MPDQSKRLILTASASSGLAARPDSVSRAASRRACRGFLPPAAPRAFGLWPA